MKYLLLVICLFFVTFNSFGQTTYKTECDSFLYWQPNVRLKIQDYKGDTSTSGMALCRKYNIHNVANVQINSVLDVPKKNRKKGKLLEKVYFAPVFCKFCSFSIKYDSIELLHDQIYFDIAEFCSRTARMKVDSIKQLLPGYGAMWITFATTQEKMINLFHDMCGSYTYQLNAKKDSFAYQKWRSMLDEALNQTNNFATKPEECYRLLSGFPLDEEYERSKTMMAPQTRKKD